MYFPAEQTIVIWHPRLCTRKKKIEAIWAPLDMDLSGVVGVTFTTILLGPGGVHKAKIYRVTPVGLRNVRAGFKCVENICPRY